MGIENAKHCAGCGRLIFVDQTHDCPGIMRMIPEECVECIYKHNCLHRNNEDGHLCEAANLKRLASRDTEIVGLKMEMTNAHARGYRDHALAMQPEIAALKAQRDRAIQERTEAASAVGIQRAHALKSRNKLVAALELAHPSQIDLDWLSTASQRHTDGIDTWWEQNRDSISFREAAERIIEIWEAGRIKTEKVQKALKEV